MGKAADGSAAPGKVFSADVVAALVMSFNVTTITKQQYELMSVMDGVKTASAFQHDFRSVLAKARDLKTRVSNGEEFLAVPPSKKRGAAAVDGLDTPPATPKKPKVAPKLKAVGKPRGKKTKAGAGAAASEESEGSPSNTLVSDGIGLGDGIHHNSKIKLETDWEHETFI